MPLRDRPDGTVVRAARQIETADQTFYLTLSQYTDTGPINPRADPTSPGAMQGRHRRTNYEVAGWTRPGIRSTPRWPSGKASASRAEVPGFDSRLRLDISGVESY